MKALTLQALERVAIDPDQYSEAPFNP